MRGLDYNDGIILRLNIYVYVGTFMLQFCLLCRLIVVSRSGKNDGKWEITLIFFNSRGSV